MVVDWLFIRRRETARRPAAVQQSRGAARSTTEKYSTSPTASSTKDSRIGTSIYLTPCSALSTSSGSRVVSDRIPLRAAFVRRDAGSTPTDPVVLCFPVPSSSIRRSRFFGPSPPRQQRRRRRRRRRRVDLSRRHVSPRRDRCRAQRSRGRDEEHVSGPADADAGIAYHPMHCSPATETRSLPTCSLAGGVFTFDRERDRALHR